MADKALAPKRACPANTVPPPNKRPRPSNDAAEPVSEAANSTALIPLEAAETEHLENLRVSLDHAAKAFDKLSESCPYDLHAYEHKFGVSERIEKVGDKLKAALEASGGLREAVKKLQGQMADLKRHVAELAGAGEKFEKPAEFDEVLDVERFTWRAMEKFRKRTAWRFSFLDARQISDHRPQVNQAG